MIRTWTQKPLLTIYMWRMMMKKKLTDLTGDGKVTQADVLRGRGVFSKGGMAAKGMAKGGSVKMAKGGMAAKGMAKGGAVMAKGGSVKMAGGGMTKGYKAGGMMAKGYKAGGVATKGGTKGGVSGGTKVTRADGIAKRGKTRGRKV